MLRFLKTLEIEQPYDPAIPLLGINTEETRIERDMCTPIFITVLFIIARTWKQPRCPSLDKWLRKLWCIYTMEYYSTIKNNTFESVLMKWKKLESIIQGFPGGSKDKASACNTGDLGSIPGLGRSPAEGHGNPLQYSGLENPHGGLQSMGSQRVGYDRAAKQTHTRTRTRTEVTLRGQPYLEGVF